jgi:GT2 family glycosyltransferase
MPVYNTDPGALSKAIASVRSQVYDKWHLCIADDGSTRPETLAILEELERDPSVSIARLAGNSGISAATNAALALAKGEFVAFLDHDDLYKPHALVQMVRWLNADPSLDMIYSDEDKVDETDRLIDPHIKPDWSPDHLRSNNYVCHLLVVRRTLVEQVGGLRTPYDGSQDYDLVLRVSEQTDRIAHIPEPLYSWRIIAGSAAADAGAKPYAWKAGKLALEDSLRRRGYPGHVEYTQNPGIYRSLYALPGQPRVAIIIPTRDRVDLLKACVESILDQSTYTNYELVIVDNQSTDAATLSYLQSAPGRVIRYPHPFNYARMMNLAAASVECDALLFLNNDTRVISPDWIESLLEHAMRPEVGAVGGRLYFEDGRSQHEGIFLGVVGLAANAHYGGFWARGEYVRNTSAVTGACMMVRPTVYGLVGGNDERLRMAYNDVDLCLRIRQAGLEVIYTPYAQLYHQESASRTYEEAED